MCIFVSVHLVLLLLTVAAVNLVDSVLAMRLYVFSVHMLTHSPGLDTGSVLVWKADSQN